MKTLAIMLSMMTLACHAQISPTIKGHKLGESLKQFISESNDLTREEMQKCQTASSVDINRCKDFLDTEESSSVSGSFDCAGAVPANPAFDAAFIRTYVDGAKVPCFEFIGKVTFENDKLVNFDLNFAGHDWDEVLPDITAKFGKPSETHVDTVQNAYGAKFDLQRDTWVTRAYVVVMREKLNLPYSLVRLVEVHITDHGYFQEQQANQPHTNALD